MELHTQGSSGTVAQQHTNNNVTNEPSTTVRTADGVTQGPWRSMHTAMRKTHPLARSFSPNDGAVEVLAVVVASDVIVPRVRVVATLRAVRQHHQRRIDAKLPLESVEYEVHDLANSKDVGGVQHTQSRGGTEPKPIP
jgi:hypothetical protein